MNIHTPSHVFPGSMLFGAMLVILLILLPIVSNAEDLGPLSDTFNEPLDSEPSITASQLKQYLKPNQLALRSSVALVRDQREQVVLYEKHASKPMAIASISKLMGAMVLIDAGLSMDEHITTFKKDKDYVRGSRSRLPIGATLTRADMLLLALAASENRAAAALARTFPDGKYAFVAAMNIKAKQLGMDNTKFMDPAGLSSGNLSTAEDLVILMDTAYQYPLIRQYTTVEDGTVADVYTSRKISFVNTNRLVRNGVWDIGLSKTGFISESGFCLVMLAEVAQRPLTIILLNSWGKLSKYGDANRIKKWLLNAERRIQKTGDSVAQLNTADESSLR